MLVIVFEDLYSIWHLFNFNDIWIIESIWNLDDVESRFFFFGELNEKKNYAKLNGHTDWRMTHEQNENNDEIHNIHWNMHNFNHIWTALMTMQSNDVELVPLNILFRLPSILKNIE